jgi:hypothetical protein
MSARIQVPASDDSKGVSIDGRDVHADRAGRWWNPDTNITGTAIIETR